MHRRCPLTSAVDDGVRTQSTMFEHLAMLVFETVPHVRTHSIAVDCRRRYATAVDGAYARVTAAVRTLL